MKINEQNGNETLHLTGFVPYRLEAKDFPLQSNFPLNILFGGFTVIDGVNMMGTALYIPVFSTFEERDEKEYMTYVNRYSVDWTVVIEYDKNKGSWFGLKYHNKEEKGGGGGGSNWNMAFSHLTMAGLVKGERVEFEKI